MSLGSDCLYQHDLSISLWIHYCQFHYQIFQLPLTRAQAQFVIHQQRQFFSNWGFRIHTEHTGSISRAELSTWPEKHKNSVESTADVSIPRFGIRWVSLSKWKLTLSLQKTISRYARADGKELARKLTDDWSVTAQTCCNEGRCNRSSACAWLLPSFHRVLPSIRQMLPPKLSRQASAITFFMPGSNLQYLSSKPSRSGAHGTWSRFLTPSR